MRVPVQIQDDAEYQLVTIRMNHKGVVPRGLKPGREIGSKIMYRVQTGQFILSGIDARNGAFGIVPPELEGAVVTNDFWYFDTDPTVINPAFFLYLTSTDLFSEICRKASDGTTNRVRLQADKFFDYELDLPPADQQAELLIRIQTTDEKLTALTTENHTQTTLLRQLRQQLLQEAVRGELTKPWREQNPSPEPASALLTRIRAEKAELIKIGKLKKEKPLPPIAPDELPFELPEGWVWCRLGEICAVTRGKSPIYVTESKFMVLNQKCVRWGDIETEHCKPVSEVWYQNLKATEKVSLNDLLVNSTGEGTIGRCAIVTEKEIGLPFDTHVLKVTPWFSEYSKFLLFVINSSFGQKQVESSKGATSTKQTELGATNLSNFMIPLPPLAEQTAIVTNVEVLLNTVGALEAEAGRQRGLAGELMQAVLGEVLGGGHDA